MRRTIIKKLLLITATLMATSIWSEVVYLDCRDLQMKAPNIALTIDAESNLVNMDGLKFKYLEYNNKFLFFAN